MEELGGAVFVRLVADKVVEVGMVGSLYADMDDCGGIVGNGAVEEGQARGANKCCIAMVGHVPCSICEDTCERMSPPRRLYGITMKRERIISWIKDCCPWVSLQRGEGIVCLLKEEHDCVGHHTLDQFLGGWAGAVDDCDDDQSNCIGIGKLGNSVALKTQQSPYAAAATAAFEAFLVSSSNLISIAKGKAKYKEEQYCW
jgi:hypothetical protein